MRTGTRPTVVRRFATVRRCGNGWEVTGWAVWSNGRVYSSMSGYACTRLGAWLATRRWSRL